MTRSPFRRATRWQVRRLRQTVTGVLAWERHITDPDAPYAAIPYDVARTELEEARLVAALNRSLDRVAKAGLAAIDLAIYELEEDMEAGLAVRHLVPRRVFDIVVSSLRIQRTGIQLAAG